MIIKYFVHVVRCSPSVTVLSKIYMYTAMKQNSTHSPDPNPRNSNTSPRPNNLSAIGQYPISRSPISPNEQIPYAPMRNFVSPNPMSRVPMGPLRYATMPRFQMAPQHRMLAMMQTPSTASLYNRAIPPAIPMNRIQQSANQSNQAQVNVQKTKQVPKTKTNQVVESSKSTSNETDNNEDTPLLTEEFDNSGEHGHLALLMHEKWLNRILDYGKSWEIRGRNTHIRGKIYLARKNCIYGETHIVDSFPITKEELAANFNLHHVDDLSIVKYKTPHIWMLEDTERYKTPIIFPRKTGQIIFCKVNMNNLQGNEISADPEDSPEEKKKAKTSRKRKASPAPSKTKKRRKVVKKASKTKASSKRKTSKKIKKSMKDDDTEDPEGTIKELRPSLSKALTKKEWNKLIDSDIWACCNKKCGGSSVMCDKCDGEWHVYCLKWTYHINNKEIKRIQQEGSPFLCMDCHRQKLGKIRTL